MIVCDHLCKQYGRQLVLSDLSYTFADTGFYLLYGESGSGKTTFLNILAGLLPYDRGSITINGHTFNSVVDHTEARLDFDYITQDPFFVDFLTVTDNARLITEDIKQVEAALARFGLSDTANQYPSTLSGGERQRLAMARAWLSGKKVLFLDEPTASLDEENKKAIFDLLNELKRDTLIICSSHDAVAKEYADEIIPFSKCTEFASVSDGELPKAIRNKRKKPNKKKKERKPIIKYLAKWFQSKKRSRGAEWKFCIFLTLAILLVLLSDIPSHKRDMNYEHSYRVNALVLKTYSKNTTTYEKLMEMPGVRDVVLSYSGSTPDGMDLDSIDPGVEIMGPEYETSLYTLPFDESLFPLSDRIEYGHYFTEEDQVLLSYEAAEKLMPGDHGKLIGSTITKNIYERGSVRFEIVGVLGRLNEFERKYLLSLNMGHDGMYFNSKLTERFMDDDTYYMGEQRTYYLYFDSYGELSDFYDENVRAFEEKQGYLGIGSRLDAGRENTTIQMLAIVLLPLSACMAIFTVLFYANLLKTEIAFNNRFVGVFEYSGYSKRRVLSCFVLLHTLRLLWFSAVSFLIALAVTGIVNFINQKVVFIGFRLFTWNTWLLSGFFLLVLAFSLCSTWLSLRRVKMANWYENILRQRDLI